MGNFSLVIGGNFEIVIGKSDAPWITIAPHDFSS